MKNNNKDNSNKKTAKIIKGLNALSHLMENIRYNYFALEIAYSKKDDTDGIEYKDVECCFNNFILTASILKQYIKSFEKYLDKKYIRSKKYTIAVNSLLNNELHLILLGMRNYLQHIFHFKIGAGNLLGNTDIEDLFISSFTLLKYNELHQNKPENIAFQNYFKHCLFLPVMDFATENMFLIEKFYQKYDKIIHEHYKNKLRNYDKDNNIDQYAMDMHKIYFENLKSFSKSNI